MAKKNLESCLLTINYEDGVNSSGEPKYKKKNYSNVKPTATTDAVYEVAASIVSLMDTTIKSISISESSTLTNE